jgi:predicted permease
MSSYINDFLHASRSLVRARAFTAVCVASLGLGLGVIIGILIFLRMVLGTPPGVNHAGLTELMIRPSGALLAEAGSSMIDNWSYPDYLDVREGAVGMAVTGWSLGEGHLRPTGETRSIALPTMYVSSNYFSTVGTTLPLGPGFTAVDDSSRAEPEAVIGHRLWQLHFASDPAIIGRSVTINQVEHVIVGVAPEKFRGHLGGLDDAYSQLWLPLTRHRRLEPRQAGPGNARLDREISWVRIIARLAPGNTLAQADATVAAVMGRLASQYPATNREKAGGVEPYFPPGARKRSQMAFGRMMIVGLLGVVLLVVGLNISGMMLARSAARERELGIRMAIGASRWRLMRHHLTEALVMAVFGGTTAAAVVFGAPVIIAWWFDYSGPTLDLFRPDAVILLQCILLCFITSLVLGLLPALRFSRPAVLAALKNDTSGSRRVGRLQRLTAAAQAGLAVPFLVISGVQFDQARVAALTDTGFEPKGLYAGRFELSSLATTDDARALFVRSVQDNLSQAPGITSVSVADGVPLDFIYRNTRIAPLAPAQDGPGSAEGGGEQGFVTAHTTRVAPGYLETIGTRLLAGRAIEVTDRPGGERVVLLSEPLALQLFPTGNPIGRRVTFALGGDERQVYTVVGVTADLVSTQFGNPRPQLFVALDQHPAASILVVARGRAGDPSVRGAFENATEDGLRQIGGMTQQPGAGPLDASSALRELITGEELIEYSQSDLLTSSGVGGAAAAVALVLSALGVYGVIAFMVATRTREIGVRVALGASRGRVLRDVLWDALKLVVPGVAVGLLLAVLFIRLANPAWYPLGGVEPLLYTLAAGIALVVAALAGLPSARRAAAVEPLIAMRSE